MRYSLKCGGRPRRKALFGADGAVMGAATLAAAAINAAATAKAASTQANAIQNNASTQAQVIKEQTRNNTALQQESMAFTRQQNKENRDQQQEIQTTLQMLAGQQNMNDRFEASKVAVKYGGRPKKRNIVNSLYGEATMPFTVTDGGGVIPIQTDGHGYGLYELYGNDHEHYHKTSSGKNKSGVGIKFSDGSVVEGEGNQNTDKGEYMFITPYDAEFISKHTIGGFNPAKAVDNGMHPEEAFNIQQVIKAMKGINDDGTQMSLPRRKKALQGLNIVDYANQTQYPQNGTASVAAGLTYGINHLPEQRLSIAKCGTHKKLKNGGRIKAEGGYWQNYGGATYSGIGNVLGAGVNVLGNYFAGRKLSDAYNRAGQIMYDAYDKMHGIDLSELSREDYAPAHAMAVVRTADTNISPQLERIRRNADAESRLVNRNTLSSAARQQRLAGINDRMFQRMGEQFAYKHNEDEKIMQGNTERIQQASALNAQLDSQSRSAYGKDRMDLLKYNNNIENSRLAGMAQSQADAITQGAGAIANSWLNSANAIGSAITGTAQGFANSFAATQKADRDFENVLIGADTEAKVNALIMRGDKTRAKALYDSFIGSTNINYQKYARQLADRFGFA